MTGDISQFNCVAIATSDIVMIVKPEWLVQSGFWQRLLGFNDRKLISPNKCMRITSRTGGEHEQPHTI